MVSRQLLLSLHLSNCKTFDLKVSAEWYILRQQHHGPLSIRDVSVKLDGSSKGGHLFVSCIQIQASFEKSLKEVAVLRTDRWRQTVTAVNLSSSKPESKAETLSPIWTCRRAKQELNTNSSAEIFFFYLLNFKCLPGQWHLLVHQWGKAGKKKKKVKEGIKDSSKVPLRWWIHSWQALLVPP